MAKPEGVRIVRTDGTELECELIQREPEDGMDVWEVTGVVFREGDKLQCAVLPPMTSITVASDIGRLRKEWR